MQKRFKKPGKCWLAFLLRILINMPKTVLKPAMLLRQNTCTTHTRNSLPQVPTYSSYGFRVLERVQWEAVDAEKASHETGSWPQKDPEVESQRV